MQKILLIDDEKGIRDSLSLILQMENYEVDSADNARTGLGLLDQGDRYDFIICDKKLPGMGGMEFLEKISEMDVASIIIMISAYGTIESSIEAIKKGADDYINKPIISEELILRMRMAEERQLLRLKNIYLQKEINTCGEYLDIVYASEKNGGGHNIV